MIFAFDQPDTDSDAPASISRDELATVVQPKARVASQAPRLSERAHRRQRQRLLQRALAKKPSKAARSKGR